MNWNKLDVILAWLAKALCFGFLMFWLLVFLGCTRYDYSKPIIYNEHQGMGYCKADSTWYNENLIDLVCKD